MKLLQMLLDLTQQQAVVVTFRVQEELPCCCFNNFFGASPLLTITMTAAESRSVFNCTFQTVRGFGASRGCTVLLLLLLLLVNQWPVMRQPHRCPAAARSNTRRRLLFLRCVGGGGSGASHDRVAVSWLLSHAASSSRRLWWWWATKTMVRCALPFTKIKFPTPDDRKLSTK